MITLLFIIILLTEILVGIFIVLKLNSFKCAVVEINSQICATDIKNVSNNIKNSVSNIKKFILITIKAQEIREKQKNLKFIINTIIAVVTLLRNKKLKHK